MERGHCQVHIPASSDHQELLQNRNPIESRLPPSKGWRVALPWSSHDRTKCFCGKGWTPSRKHRAQEYGSAYPLGVRPRFKFPFPHVGRTSKQSRQTDVLALLAGIKCQMEETFSAGLDWTTPLSPPLQLRAEIVPASAQGTTAGHPPPNNYATAGRPVDVSLSQTL